MHTITVFLALFALVVAAEVHTHNDCLFQVNGEQYDFSPLRGQTFVYTAKDGSFNATYSLCGNISATNSGCNSGSAVCITRPSKSPVSFGNASMVSILSAEGSDSLTMIVAGGDECAYGAKRRTTFHMMCRSLNTVSSAELYSCSASFTIYTPYACHGNSVMDGPDGEWNEPHYHFGPFFVFFALTLACMSVCICVCACCRRKRMMEARKKRALEMINVAFQPIPQQEPKTETVKPQPLQAPVRLPVPVPVQHIPSYYPPVQYQPSHLQPPQFQPAQYYLYPAVQHPIQFQPAAFSNPQTNQQH